MNYEQRFLMGNEAIAWGAIHAGVNLVAGYPGTPSTEILETVAKENDGSIYVEWSGNEKAAMEVAAGAAFSGARCLVTMKQVGLNVASDPLMSLAYVGVKGGMVIVSADDPGPISSQTEQDTRHFAQFAKLPVFDPSSPEEAYEMMMDAFECSERLGTPVLFRPTTRVCHGCASVPVRTTYEKHSVEGFVKDTARWVIFPKMSYRNHMKIEDRNRELAKEFGDYRFNLTKVYGNKDAVELGICTGGISYAYTCEALSALEREFDGKMPGVKVLKIATAHPFPKTLALNTFAGLRRVLCIEELDPVLEREMLILVGEEHLPLEITGKTDVFMEQAGEYTVESVKAKIAAFLGLTLENVATADETPELPVRPPVLCAGCPHRASFYAVKQATKGRKAVYSGDIGCYTLGNAAPLDMCDTCLCMGADITMAQGLHRMEPDALNFSFIGDSTFFASGLTGVVNAVYNGTDITVIVLDNSTTAMTGHQPHPGTGVRMMEFANHGKPKDVCAAVSIEKVLEGIGCSEIRKADPLNLEEAVNTVKEVMDLPGVKAVILKCPCAVIVKPEKAYHINDSCINCMRCIREIGCPAIVLEDGKPTIDASLCNGCGLCSQLCPKEAIVHE